MFCRALDGGAELHLIDPFVDESGAALPPGWSSTPTAARLTVWRAAWRGGPKVRWHIARSQDVGRRWTAGPVDLVFIDGDHSLEGCREDWLPQPVAFQAAGPGGRDRPARCSIGAWRHR